ncbi:SMI1/KNR4 family protein [Paenibacillus glycanilyticus]|uniref:SMI1/KNR4 family protein n=1 Tax=Paenibacillus glycanilyticus TaxID=126569 RepID=UPI003EBDBF94
MKNDFNFVNVLLESRIAKLHEIKGCSESEIKELEIKINHIFPPDYREFLQIAGHGAGLLFRGTDIYFKNIKELTKEATELLRDNEESFTLPEDAFVFCMHQGYEFNYFRFSEGKEPPIYQYIEGEGEPRIVWHDFKSFLLEEINNNLKK